jgi:hypothetical protein
MVGCLLLIIGRKASKANPYVATFGASLMVLGGTAAILGGVFWAFD